MASKEPGGKLRVVQRTVNVVVALTPVLSHGPLEDPLPPRGPVGPFNGWRDVLDIIGQIFPEFSVILDVVRFVVSVMNCAGI